MSSVYSLHFETDLCNYNQSDQFVFLPLYSRIADLTELWRILKIRYLKIKRVALSLYLVVDAPSVILLLFR